MKLHVGRSFASGRGHTQIRDEEDTLVADVYGERKNAELLVQRFNGVECLEEFMEKADGAWDGDLYSRDVAEALQCRK